ncbi:coenzyme F390 synthetase [Capnocytophaga ochracea]|uniref:Coenzyme F390 synthetase n=1 Tax=Capnocytophaga ochracea TaxID=1018 RepID=A0A2X2T478_CAPOC|nr:coenzyme F390 synthetase [Capnocytophaga ochracea]
MSALIPTIETQSEAEIIAFQEEKLRELLQYLNEKSVFYQNLFRKHHIRIEDIRTLADLQKYPQPIKTICNARTTLFSAYLKLLL